MNKLVFLVLGLVFLLALGGCAQQEDEAPEEVSATEDIPEPEAIPEPETTPDDVIRQEIEQIIDENEDVDIGDVI